MPTIYTIGFSGKNIDVLRDVLAAVGVRCLIDIRRFPVSKYAAWADGESLCVAFGGQYKHMPELAPSVGLLTTYKAGAVDWSLFAKRFNENLAGQAPEKLFTTDSLHKICLLCTEKTADKCHRRLVAEYLTTKFPDVNIVHL